MKALFDLLYSVYHPSPQMVQEKIDSMIAQVESQGGKVVDVKVENSSTGFSITVLYTNPSKEDIEEMLKKPRIQTF